MKELKSHRMLVPDCIFSHSLQYRSKDHSVQNCPFTSVQKNAGLSALHDTQIPPPRLPPTTMIRSPIHSAWLINTTPNQLPHTGRSMSWIQEFAADTTSCSLCRMSWSQEFAAETASLSQTQADDCSLPNSFRTPIPFEIASNTSSCMCMCDYHLKSYYRL